MSEGPRPTMRVDKWLWQTRFFKTRALAARTVTAGIRIDGEPAAKPHRAVGTGDVLTFPQATRVRVVRILALPVRRGPAPEAQACYEDLSPPPEPAPPPGPARQGGRPTGRDRRRTDALRGTGGGMDEA